MSDYCEKKEGDKMKVDLNKVYHLAEYKKAISYANKNIEIEGVQELATKLDSIKADYCSSVERVTEPEKEVENHKYQIY